MQQLGVNAIAKLVHIIDAIGVTKASIRVTPAHQPERTHHFTLSNPLLGGISHSQRSILATFSTGQAPDERLFIHLDRISCIVTSTRSHTVGPSINEVAPSCSLFNGYVSCDRLSTRSSASASPKPSFSSSNPDST